jgi:hypothetical protein
MEKKGGKLRLLEQLAKQIKIKGARASSGRTGHRISSHMALLERAGRGGHDGGLSCLPGSSARGDNAQVTETIGQQNQYKALKRLRTDGVRQVRPPS